MHFLYLSPHLSLHYSSHPIWCFSDFLLIFRAFHAFYNPLLSYARVIPSEFAFMKREIAGYLLGNTFFYLFSFLSSLLLLSWKGFTLVGWGIRGFIFYSLIKFSFNSGQNFQKASPLLFFSFPLPSFFLMIF